MYHKRMSVGVKGAASITRRDLPHGRQERRYRPSRPLKGWHVSFQVQRSLKPIDLFAGILL
jgi:hypothetical protein